MNHFYQWVYNAVPAAFIAVHIESEERSCYSIMYGSASGSILTHNLPQEAYGQSSDVTEPVTPPDLNKPSQSPTSCSSS